MHIACIKEKLEEALVKAEKVTGKNVTLPVLKSFYLKAEKNTLIVRTTNLDLGVEIKVPVKVIKEGVVAVGADVLRSYITNLSGVASLTLKLEDTVLLVSSDHTKTKIKTEQHSDFPSLPVVESDSKIILPVDSLILGIKSVIYSSAVTSMKPELSSVLMYSDGTSLIFVATDSFRLAEKRVALEKAVEIESILIPFKNASDIVRLLDGVSGDIELVAKETQMSLQGSGLYITSRVVDGSFPDYGQIIPKEYATEAVVLKEDLIAGLKLANIFSDKFNQITFSITEGDIALTTQNVDKGENTTHVKASLTGGDIDITFNHRYIFDSFQSIKTDSVSLWFTPGKPLVIRGVGDSSFLYLVMPINNS